MSAAEQALPPASPRITYHVKSAAEREQRVVKAPLGLTVEFLRREEHGEPPVVMSLYGWEYEDASRYELVVSPWRGPDDYVRADDIAQRFGWQLTASVAPIEELPDGRLYWGWGNDLYHAADELFAGESPTTEDE